LINKCNLYFYNFKKPYAASETPIPFDTCLLLAPAHIWSWAFNKLFLNSITTNSSFIPILPRFFQITGSSGVSIQVLTATCVMAFSILLDFLFFAACFYCTSTCKRNICHNILFTSPNNCTIEYEYTFAFCKPSPY
jgi:hypothetical protein